MTALRVGVAVLVLLDVAYAALLWPGVAPVNDYVGFVAGGKALLAGQDPYDAASWRAFAGTVGQRADTDVFGYPPWVAVAFVPLGLLPTLVGSVIWTAGGMALAAFAVAALSRRHGWSPLPGVALALASWPALLQLVQGQWGFLLVALSIALLLDLERGNDLRAGIWWALGLLAKPQLFAFGSFVLLGWLVWTRRGRPIASAIAAIATAVTVGTIVVPHWLGPYVVAVLPARSSRTLQQPTLAGLAGDVAGALWPVAWVLFVAALAALTLWSVRRAPAGSRAPLAAGQVLALSVVAAPYSWSYDHYLAVPLGATTIALASRSGGRVRALLIAAVVVVLGPLAFVLFESAYLRWHDTLAALVPVSAIVLGAIAARTVRSART